MGVTTERFQTSRCPVSEIDWARLVFVWCMGLMANPVAVSTKDRAVMEGGLRCPTTSQCMATRARIIPSCAKTQRKESGEILAGCALERVALQAS